MINTTFYNLKPIIPRKVQIFFRRIFANYKRKKYKAIWPIDPKCATPPNGWKGWPDKKSFALVLSHDVDTQRGHDRAYALLEIEKRLGFKSAFNFVPERYNLSRELIDKIKKEGFEVNVHGLKHDGKLFKSRKIFNARAKKINSYLKDWQSEGFTAPSMICNPNWIHDLNVKHCTCTFDTDPFEPQPNPSKTIFPFAVLNPINGNRYIEIPYTLPQDHALFVILQETGIDIWKSKLDWIASNGGMALLNTHPDYMDFCEVDHRNEVYPIEWYVDFLKYIKKFYNGRYYNAFPSEISEFWNSQENLSIETQELMQPTIVKAKNSVKRICMLAYTFYESDFRVTRYAEALAENGYHVDVIALREPKDEYYSIINGVHVYRVQGRIFNEKNKFSYLHRILKFIFRSGLFISKMTLKNKYDLLHVHNVPDFLVFAAIAPKLQGSKIILDIHDILPEFYASKFSMGSKNLMFRLMLLVEKLSIKFSDHVIISNHIWENKLVSRSVNPEKCSAIINYADQDIFYPRKKDKAGDTLIMLYPGTVNWHQGLDIAVRAFARIKNIVPNLDFHIYGSGTHIGDVQKLIKKFKLQNRVLLFEGLSIHEISEVIAKADIGIIPKRNDPFGGEAFSTKTLEFMSSGVPIIVSRTRIDQHYFNDTCVKFFESENIDDLSNAILQLAKDANLRAQYANNGLNFVSNFSWKEKQIAYFRIIDSLFK